MARRRTGSRRLAEAAALASALLSFIACSALITHDTEQCKVDKDCESFHAVCDTSTHVCVSPTTSSSGSGGGSSSSSGGGAGGSGGSCTGDASCYACTPKTTNEFLNACSDATCKHFDNARCTKLSPDGGLPKLP